MSARRLPRTAPVDTLRVVGSVLVPLVARGLIIRRPRVLAVLDAVDADDRALRTLEDVRARYGAGPVRLGVPGRKMVLVLDPADAREVLTRTPEPFSPATREKRAALDQLEPHGVLISSAAQRPARRRFNEAVLETGRPVHSHADAVDTAVRACADELLHVAARDDGVLTWETFAPAWWRLVRTVVLGTGARDDVALTDRLADLRRAANWGFLPRRRRTRAAFGARLERHLRRQEPGSLAEVVGRTPAAPGTDPAGQVPQWLFAFDAAGISTFRALSLLAAHPQVQAELRSEARAEPPEERHRRPTGRATVLEALRLWPTTPAILRESTIRTSWPRGPVPSGTLLLVHAPLLHRGGPHPWAHRFSPQLWRDGGAGPEALLVPFSAGPARCAGEDLVLLVTSALLARLLATHEVRHAGPSPLPDPDRLPMSLSPYGLRLRLDAGTG